jgi:SH3-like domain-containing protein
MKNPATVMYLMIAVLLGSNAFIPASSAEMKLSPEAAEEVPKADSEVVFRVSDVNLRSGPGTQLPVIRVLSDAKGTAASFFGETGNWTKIVFEGQPYWVHVSLIHN